MWYEQASLSWPHTYRNSAGSARTGRISIKEWPSLIVWSQLLEWLLSKGPAGTFFLICICRWWSLYSDSVGCRFQNTMSWPGGFLYPPHLCGWRTFFFLFSFKPTGRNLIISSSGHMFLDCSVSLFSLLFECSITLLVECSYHFFF